ncbi:hypothetical protein [Streptomyces hydrogenans]|uniref:hypothetical protein n=1 Tax=Streptomyces hydrogenans TaxID=1873719 RepID=UPI00380C4445
MAKRDKKVPRRKPDVTCFVQVASKPSIGVEVSTGRAWIGVDQQVGHGSADALFALTDEQYAAALVDVSAVGSFQMECWRGEHDDLRLFDPRGGAWSPERWFRSRQRVIPPRFAGEIWHHVDALGDVPDGERVGVSRGLAAGTARVSDGPDGVSGLEFALVGDGAYPRPAALIAGLAAGSERERARAVLGDPVEGAADTYAIEGERVRLGYVDDGLAEIALERPAPAPLPDGPMRTFLTLLGEPEAGADFREVARLVGGTGRRWAVSSGFTRRLIVFDGGVEVQVQDGRVLSTRIRFDGSGTGFAHRHVDTLFPGASRPLSRADVHQELGLPVATAGRADLHRYGAYDLVVEYARTADRETPGEITTVLRGTSVSHGIHRWRSGEFTLFLDVLGLEGAHPLVQYVRELAGVRVQTRGGAVTEVTIGRHGHRAERLAAFVDGMLAEPTRKDLPFGVPTYTGERDDLRDFAQGWIHVHASDGEAITTITVSQEPPRDVGVRRWQARGER